MFFFDTMSWWFSKTATMYFFLCIYVFFPEPLRAFTSNCPLKVDLSQGLGPFFQVTLFENWPYYHTSHQRRQCLDSAYILSYAGDAKHHPRTEAQICFQTFRASLPDRGVRAGPSRLRDMLFYAIT